MEKLRYNRTFKQGILAIIIGVLLFGGIISFFIIARIQYSNLVSEMVPTKATIVDIDYDVHRYGPDEQKIEITYKVDGITYSRELETDTKISFSAGTGAHYSIGDKVDILYDPENPEIIASPRSVRVGWFYLVVGSVGLAFTLYGFVYMIMHSKKFLVTQKEYIEEGEERKRIKREKRQQRKNKNPKLRKAVKIILIVLAALLGAFILYLLLGTLLIALVD